jgi:hypothetical protein
VRARPAVPHRALRGWLLALPSMALAVTGHGLAGGGIPDLGIALPLTALIAWAGGTLVHRLRGPALIGLLGVIQVALHLLLTQLAHGHGPAPVGGWAMFAAHAIATVITAGLLARASVALTVGSAALDRLRGLLALLWSAPVPVPAAIGPSSAVPDRPGPLLEILLRRVRTRRGPPARS